MGGQGGSPADNGLQPATQACRHLAEHQLVEKGGSLGKYRGGGVGGAHIGEVGWVAHIQWRWGGWRAYSGGGVGGGVGEDWGWGGSCRGHQACCPTAFVSSRHVRLKVKGRPKSRPKGRPKGRPNGRPKGRPNGRPKGRPNGRPKGA